MAKYLIEKPIDITKYLNTEDSLESITDEEWEQLSYNPEWYNHLRSLCKTPEEIEHINNLEQTYGIKEQITWGEYCREMRSQCKAKDRHLVEGVLEAIDTSMREYPKDLWKFERCYNGDVLVRRKIHSQMN